ncbi:MAG: AIR carboxylase family protein [Clostridiales bacterium]|jgi:5-(carboxyamino)imidazole ribonucleotide mutase|nr:AIR carboxylase family protein [Clostridiales bacterium]
MNRKIAVVMGSDSDYKIMARMIPVLKENGVDYEFRVISAHRTPLIATEFAEKARANGFDLIIAGAGMSAHLAGVLAACTAVPVIGLPIKSASSGMDGMDALHSIIQMPPGIPVAAVGIDDAEGAAKLAVKMLNASGSPTVKIVGGQSDDNIEKVTKTLSVYGIGTDDQSASVLIHLTDAPVETALPVICVPMKAAGSQFGETSRKIYDQTNNAKAAAFVGVGAYQNAAHLAARIFGIHENALYEAVIKEHAKLAAAVIEKDEKLRAEVNAEK